MRYLLRALLLLITISCSFDYDIGDDLPQFKSQVVLNSTIAPHKPIQIEMLWSIPHYNSDSAKVDFFNVKIFKDGEPILDSIGKGGLFKTNIYPLAGSSYSLEVDVADYGLLKAETDIPSKHYEIKVDPIMEKMPDNGQSFLYYEFSKIDVSEQTRALWIKNIRIYTNYNSYGIFLFFVTNPYLDQVNAVYNSPSNFQFANLALTGSVIVHKDFLRVPFKNLSKVFPINLCVITSTTQLDYLVSTKFGIITPSDDYDRYYRDYYRDTPSGSISIGSKNVYSNIKGGLGIFAGYIEEVETIIYSKQTQK